MVNALFATKHDHCALCGLALPLLVLKLTAGEAPRLEEKPADTHTGVCRLCWWRVRKALGNGLRRA